MNQRTDARSQRTDGQHMGLAVGARCWRSLLAKITDLQQAARSQEDRSQRQSPECKYTKAFRHISRYILWVKALRLYWTIILKQLIIFQH